LRGGDDPEVGWLIDIPWQGKGLATEAGAACLALGFEELGFRANRQHLHRRERCVSPRDGKAPFASMAERRRFGSRVPADGA
jgi:Acetyltransferase (GNAT) domain